ncbi:MAG: GNAT family N-acetyltransferase [Oscillospiraceae bacterium]|jgi:ribosomal protein S18 acetylase RimI-like enzyme
MYSSCDIVFRRALISDCDDVFRLFEQAVREMNRRNIPQWDEVYPDRDTLLQDIFKEQMHIGLIDGRIACAYVVNSEYDEQYKNGNWRYPDASYRVIHRLCVSPDYQNKGVGAAAVRHIEQSLRSEGVEAVRLDAFTLNPFALRLYEKLGYSVAGFADFRKGRFCLMEKKL